MLQFSGWEKLFCATSELHFISSHHNASPDHKNVNFPIDDDLKAFPMQSVMNATLSAVGAQFDSMKYASRESKKQKQSQQLTK